MRIQIKSLTGPDEIMRPSEARTDYGAAPTTETGNTLFTCLLNRNVTDDDSDDFPLIITLHIFDQHGNAMVNNGVTLTVARDHIQNNNSFRFALNIPSASLGGSHIYVHAVRENADGQNVSYNTSSYHETIKKVYIYAQKHFLRVYWSANEQISETNPEPAEAAAEQDTNATPAAEATAEQDTNATPAAEETPEGDQEQPAENANAAQQNQDIPAEMNTQEEGLIKTKAGNEDAFIHIKAQGMYSERIGLVITSEDNTFLFRSPITLKRNRKVVAISMTDIRNRYREAKDLEPDNDLGTIRIRATVAIRHPEYLTRHTKNQQENETTPEAEPNTEGPTQQEAPAPDQQEETPAPVDTLHENIRTELQTVLPNNIPNTVTDSTLIQAMRNDFVYMQSALLTIDADADIPVMKTSTSTVYVNAENREITVTETTRFRDFSIGYMCHLAGIGRKVNKHDNPSTDDPKFTVYPFSVYEILLSDLVACGILTIEEAIYIAPRTKTRENLETIFNKVTGNIAANVTLISRFLDTNSRADSKALRKVLAQVRTKTASFSEDICRDGWQKVRSTGAVLTRPDDLRYTTNKECPPGEFFVNYKTGGTYRLYVSRLTASGNTDNDLYRITTYIGAPNTVERSAIAFHRGGSGNAVGCITFNHAYSGDKNDGSGNTEKGNYSRFNNQLYGDSTNDRKLNLLCSDERNAIRKDNDTETINNTSNNFNRYYDLVEP